MHAILDNLCICYIEYLTVKYKQPAISLMMTYLCGVYYVCAHECVRGCARFIPGVFAACLLGNSLFAPPLPLSPPPCVNQALRRFENTA